MKAVENLRLFSCVLIFMATSCIKENLDICLPQPVFISFSFVPSQTCAHEFFVPDDLNRLTVFVFDDNGLFLQQVDALPTGDRYQVELSLEPAHYQIFAVAGYDRDQMQSAPFIPGKTNLLDASVSSYLEHRDGSLLSAKQALFIGSHTLTVSSKLQDQKYLMTLIQKTKTLHITVDGISHALYQIALAGNAARYRFDMDQVYLTGNPLMYFSLEGEGHRYTGRTLINWPMRGEGNYTRLQIINPATGMRLLNEDLLELLFRVPGIDLECAAAFHVEIEYRVTTGLAIYINNWRVHSGGYVLI
ncbi:FimB/Mfa2 family fimbrial subunit [Parapedobacter deserti]|uniref:FimB/Mfa2 family fimbrial subunit n=1 Tax=Parapedobacter deserti TaxID=1912957 RepID=A0ABV7JMZ2_9SPHI